MTASTRIRVVKATEVVVPAKPGAICSPEMGGHMASWDQLPICLLEIEMADGIRALGEVERGHTLAGLEPWLARLPGLAINGLCPQLPETWWADAGWGMHTSHPPPRWRSPSPSPVVPALEIALLDWAAKRLDCRVVDLLGGAYRETVPVDFWCSRQTPSDLARLVTEARRRGFTGLKMKSTLGDPVVEQVRAVKEAGGADFGLTIDPMTQWLSPHHALALFKTLEPYAENLRIEDPFPQDQPEFWRRVRQVSPIPLMWHARSLDDLRRALAENVADDFNCTGWIQEFLVLAHAVEVAGHSCWHGSGIELGVAQIARLHAAAAARACVLHSDIVSGLIRQHTLITWDWPYRAGHLPLPSGPGLGIELDAEAVRHYRRGEATYEAA